MATESPVRMVESGEGRKWPAFKDSIVIGSNIKSTAEEEFELLLKGCRIGDQQDMIPSRSGSAPPSMEGSFAAIGNLLAPQNFSTNSSLEILSEVIGNFDSEEELRSDPAYFAYYCANVNLNPRLPPPLMSRENRHLVRHIGGHGNNRRPSSVNDDGIRALQFAKVSLPTHKEESEDDASPEEASDKSVLLAPGQNISLSGRHKSLVDLIQEDFPRTPSPVYSHSRSSNVAAEEATSHEIPAISSNISSLKFAKVSELDPVFSDLTLEASVLESQASQQIDKPKNGDVSLERSSSLAGSRSSDTVRETPQHSSNPPRIAHQVAAVHPQSFSRSHANLSPAEIQPPPSYPPALNPPLYAAAAAYMNSGAPLLPNFQPSGLYSSQYGVAGYAFGSGYGPPFIAGYPTQSSISMAFGTSSSTGETIQHAGVFQQLGKMYGQQELVLQPTFSDPRQLPYFQQPIGDVYGATAPHNLIPLGTATGSLGGGPFSAPRSPGTNTKDRRFQLTTDPNFYVPGMGGAGLTGSNYYIGSHGMGFVPQFPASPLTSPTLPSSPIGGTSPLGRQNNMLFSQGFRNIGPFINGQGQRGLRSFDDPKRHYLLEEIKSSNSRKVELSDIAGHIVEFSVDQHGSRYIQQKLEKCSTEEKISVFKEVLPHSAKLMTDVFGNYVIQKFLEHGSPEQRRELADRLSGQMPHLSLQMYGCRVIQKALEVIEFEQKARLVQELDGHVVRCVHDQNGNHVIQKCIECLQAENNQFIISSFRGQVATLSTHPYGCRVIQRVLEHCLDESQNQFIVDEILESTDILAQDQYGNYVTQHVLERGNPEERRQIISKLAGKVVQMSQHKYASNVVEKCLEYGGRADRDLLIEEIIGQSEGNDNLLTMIKDQFGNYVIQKILDVSSDEQRKILLECIRSHLHALKKYTYGKHIVARFEQLCGEENPATTES